MWADANEGYMQLFDMIYIKYFQWNKFIDYRCVDTDIIPYSLIKTDF